MKKMEEVISEIGEMNKALDPKIIDVTSQTVVAVYERLTKCS